jgi:hypothetical protein
MQGSSNDENASPVQLAPTEPSFNESASAVPASNIINPDILGRRKFHFAIALEAVFNNITPKFEIGKKVSSDFYLDGGSYARKLIAATRVERSQQIAPAFQVNCSYKNFGFNAGVAYMSYETRVNTEDLSFTITKREIDKITVHESNGATKTDTLYKMVQGPKSIVLNGDTVNSGEYLSATRIVNVPLSFSYKMSLMKKKLIVEPAVGAVVGLPLRTKQLVATKPHEFVYEPTRRSLSSVFLMYDLSLKLQYKVAGSGYVYIKQGYLFTNQSLNSSAYVMRTTLSNMYTSIGISVSLY